MQGYSNELEEPCSEANGEVSAGMETFTIKKYILYEICIKIKCKIFEI